MTKAYDELVDFIAAGTTPASVLDFQPSAESELDDYLKLEHLMRLAKARARSRLGRE
jgi:hypothetical protein